VLFTGARAGKAVLDVAVSTLDVGVQRAVASSRLAPANEQCYAGGV
jgi:hypothetical protein